jgi:hypothetical protein
MAHLSSSDMGGPEIGASASEGRGPTPEVRAAPAEGRTTTTETRHAAHWEPETRTRAETGRMAEPETRGATTEETRRMAREDRFRDDRDREERFAAERRPPPREVERRNGSVTWPYWLLPLAALAGLGWYLLSGDQWRGQVAEAPGTAGTETRARPSLVVGGVDLGRQTTTAAEGLGTVLQGIKDRATATTMLPRLQEAARDLDRMAAMSGQLSQEGRAALASTTSSALSKLNTALDKAAAMPDVAPMLQPTLDQMRGRIDMIAQAQLPGRSFYAAAPSDWVLLSTLLNRDVHNAGERLGTVNEVVLGPDHRVAAVVVGIGRDLGFGEKTIAIPFGHSQMQRQGDRMRLVIDATKESLRSAPAYQPPR